MQFQKSQSRWTRSYPRTGGVLRAKCEHTARHLMSQSPLPKYSRVALLSPCEDAVTLPNPKSRLLADVGKLASLEVAAMRLLRSCGAAPVRSPPRFPVHKLAKTPAIYRVAGISREAFTGPIWSNRLA